MAYNSATTFGEITSLASEIFAENDILVLRKRDLARIFLRRLLDLDETADDAKLEDAYRTASSREGVPDDQGLFWGFIEKEYLGLEQEPQDKFLDTCIQVNRDLVSIAKNLTYINNEKETLAKKITTGGRLSPEERYYRNQLAYYEDKNLLARSEIVEFLTHKIKQHAISKASFSKFNFVGHWLPFFSDSPYSFGTRDCWGLGDAYDPRSLDEFSNKFMDLPVTTYREIIRECRGSADKFREYANLYINGIPNELPSVSEKIRDLMGKSHILFNRQKVLTTMLGHYENRDYISFVSMAPLQIEGIFADVCRDIGVSETQLDISSLNDKLLHIDGKVRSFFSFEYYSFRFPVLRNLVAHGGLIDGDFEDTAIHLILDLLPVCELTVSDDLPVVNALKILRDASDGDPKKLAEWLELRNSIHIPEFYDALDLKRRADEHYASPRFWDYLQKELNSINAVGDLKRSRPIKIAGELKRLGLAADRAEVFLRTSFVVASEHINKRRELLESLIGRLKPNS